uniref:Uncharacterized protein n=1 Tax=viral metagenome TaxID=1070528 RepID=A0A6M3Y142_9ZZZZ
MATNDVVINDLIHFELGDTEMVKLLGFLYSNAVLVMDCGGCGTTIIPQARSQHSNTGKEEFKVSCVNCGRSSTVRMFGKYGFILPTDDEFYKGKSRADGWEH